MTINRKPLSLTKANLIKVARRMAGRRSHWDRAIRKYVAEIVENAQLERNELASIPNYVQLETRLLNGASSWVHYSEGGCSLVYAGDLCKRLCTPSEFRELKRTGLMYSAETDWIEIQGRALEDAFCAIARAFQALKSKAEF